MPAQCSPTDGASPPPRTPMRSILFTVLLGAATLARAQASFDQNAADFKRYRDLHEQGFIGPAELDRRDMALKTARAQLDQAKAQASVQGNQAAYAALVADASGVITGVDLEPG